MNSIKTKHECPLCGKDKYMGEKAKILYGYQICKKCYYTFANRRQFAFIIDIILWSVFYILVMEIAGVAGITDRAIQSVAFLLCLIFCMKDGFSGHSLGKAIMGIRVIDKLTNEPCGFGVSFKRNLPFLFPFIVFIVALTLHKGKRIGDGWSNSCVIWKKYKEKEPFKIGIFINQ